MGFGGYSFMQNQLPPEITPDGITESSRQLVVTFGEKV